MKFLDSEKRFIDDFLKIGEKVSKEFAFQEPKVLMRTLRRRLKMTQKQLANRVKLPQSYIANIELGKINPSLHTLQKIFQGMGCSLRILVVPEVAPDILLDRQAHLIPEKKMGYVASTMSLEAQRPSQAVVQSMILKEKDKLLKSNTRKIWDA